MPLQSVAFLFQISYSRQVLAQPNIKICLSYAPCPMPIFKLVL
ncbi:hypothetical protein FDUTEX481_08349 [Tolypothrix sp. PCC 7601]|nr:hypothetical protein [Tolypothrix sp. PCC 7712]EKF01038.1 hypothetical protein FDUTEX481_08349 [Tolypothrix sp. PCC 7601]